MAFDLNTAAEIALSSHLGRPTFADSAVRAEALFSVLAAQDAAAAYARTAQLAKTPEQIQREFIEGQRAAARRFLELAIEHRAWRRVATAEGLGLPGSFFRDEVPALLKAVRRHRRAAQAASAQLASMVAAQAQRVAA